MTPRAVRVTDEIHQVGGAGLTAPEDAAIYLVEFDGHTALIDSGCGGGEDRLLAISYPCPASSRPIRLPTLLCRECWEPSVPRTRRRTPRATPWRRPDGSWA